MKIENHGSFCNIYRNGGIAFGTKEYSIAKSKLLEKGFDLDEKAPLFAAALKQGIATLALDPIVEFLFPEDREDIRNEVMEAVK